MMNVSETDIINAINAATDGREKRPDVERFIKDFPALVRALCHDVGSGGYVAKIHFSQKDIVNVNGKKRHLLVPDIYTLTMQHLSIALLTPYYNIKDPMVGVNCKKRCGVNSKWKHGSVARRVKHIFYDRRDLEYTLVIDQRKCYDHMTPKLYRRALKYLGVPKKLVDFSVNVTFADDTFPIGTPTSPFAHHIIMLAFDHAAKEMSGTVVRYADDVLMAFHTKEEAQRAKWRVKNWWWYTMGVRAKRHTEQIRPMTEPTDFCGIVFRRKNDRGVSDHDKGYAKLRERIAARARKANPKSYPSYYGLLRAVDGFGLMSKIEKDMNLQDLTAQIKINRALDAPNISVKELAENGTVFTIHDYETRCDRSNVTNWIKCLISFKDPSANGRRVMREFHGNYQGIICFHLECENRMDKDAMLPLTGVKIVNACGYIYEGSTNMLDYIDDRPEFN